MGKRKKSTRGQPGGGKKRTPLPSQFQCLFCNHETSVTVKLDKKAGIGTLSCKVCGQSYQTSVHMLSEGVDVYSEWIDACENVNNQDTSDSPPPFRHSANEGGAMPKARQGPTPRGEEYEDDFVVNDEEGMENEFAEEND